MVRAILVHPGELHNFNFLAPCLVHTPLQMALLVHPSLEHGFVYRFFFCFLAACSVFVSDLSIDDLFFLFFRAASILFFVDPSASIVTEVKRGEVCLGRVDEDSDFAAAAAAASALLRMES